MRSKYLFLKNLLGALLFSFSACVDPVPPEFEFKDGLIFIDGLVSDRPDLTFVKVSESSLDGNRYTNEFIFGASVLIRNVNTDATTVLVETGDRYLPPTDFTADPGDTFELQIILPDGRTFRSLPEEMTTAVPIVGMGANYDPELVFRDASDTFVPGHSVLASFNDPPGEDNYYYWRFRSFEQLPFCQTCVESIFRNGRCETNSSAEGLIRKPYYTYACDSRCWRIRFSETVEILSDEFVNGSFVEALPVGNALLYSKEDVLIELQQFSLSPSAHRYFRVLRDILDNNGGFNAPPPAALVGNMFAVDNTEEFVLGRFTAAAASVSHLFIDRTAIPESQIEERRPALFEEMGEVPPPEIFTAPCEETTTRTGVRPPGWID
ncbi:DUF4249 domain-containing protein [Spongiimicrobium sp. 2-473A-2-J]|uniref:DUF4249 domain-containing protein n=1 Tax=Eudoraea algarum TaxID=3417568 RepID=UPI003D36DEE1